VRASATVSASDGVDPAYVDRFATAGGPGSRHAIAVAAGGDGRGFYLFGGSRHGKTGFRPKVFDDLWYFREADAHAEVADELLGAWTFLGKARSGAPLPPAWPAARSHHSLVTLGAESGVDVGVLLFGGALCVPGCSCYNDTWVWRPESRRFSPVQVSEPPIWRYRQSLVSTANDGSFFLFGGESYKPYMYHNSVSKLKLPEGWLDAQIARARARQPPTGAAGSDTMAAWSPPRSALATEAGAGAANLKAGGSPLMIICGIALLALLALCGWRSSSKRRGYAKAGAADVEP